VSTQRADLHRSFVERFSVQTFAPAEEAALDAAEARLSVRLPESYRAFMKSYGGAYTPGLLGLIVERQLNYHDLQNIEPLKGMVEGTETYWRGGMPEILVSFGGDCMGNALCFERTTSTRDDAPVRFFDHDFFKVAEIAASFDALLEQFLKDSKETPVGVCRRTLNLSP
jgi:hypothetical protein